MVPSFTFAHSAERMALVELAFVQSAVRTTVVKEAFGHLAGRPRMAVVDMTFGH